MNIRLKYLMVSIIGGLAFALPFNTIAQNDTIYPPLMNNHKLLYEIDSAINFKYLKRELSIGRNLKFEILKYYFLSGNAMLTNFNDTTFNKEDFEYIGTTLRIGTFERERSTQELNVFEQKFDHELEQIEIDGSWIVLLADIFSKQIDKQFHKIEMIRLKLEFPKSSRVDIYKKIGLQNSDYDQWSLTPMGRKQKGANESKVYYQIQIHATTKKLTSERVLLEEKKIGMEIEYEYIAHSKIPHKYRVKRRFYDHKSLYGACDQLRERGVTFFIVSQIK